MKRFERSKNRHLDRAKRIVKLLSTQHDSKPTNKNAWTLDDEKFINSSTKLNINSDSIQINSSGSNLYAKCSNRERTVDESNLDDDSCTYIECDLSLVKASRVTRSGIL